MAKFAFFGTQATVLDMAKLAQGRVHVLEAVMGQKSFAFVEGKPKGWVS